jgi:nitrogen fixation protein FixH
VTAPGTPQPRKAGWWWPWLIAALLVATAAGQGVIWYLATHDPTFAVEADYYRKAMAWDSTMARDRENLALGWTAQAEALAGPGEAMTVAVTLRDRAGALVSGARVQATAVSNLDASHPVALSLAESGGAYRAAVPGARRGLWELRVDARSNGARFTPILRVEHRP